MCRALALARDWEVDEDWVLVENDPSASSKKARPQFERLMAAMASGQVRAVIAYRVDRRVRRLGDMARLVDLAKDKGAIHAWARGQRVNVDHWHVDAGKSGCSLDGRPEAVLMLASLQPGDKVVVAKLDRLSRSLLDFAGLLVRSQKEGWAVVALDLGIDMSSPSGRMVAGVLATIAQWEREVIGERTSQALQQAKARGRLPGKRSSLPRDVQDLLVQMADEGVLTLKQRADLLNERGIPTATGAGPWSTGIVDGATRSARLEAAARLVQAEQGVAS